jgi:hypothetical protein
MANIPTTAWAETTPSGGDNLSAGDNRIREMKTQIREVIDVDHDFPSSGQAADVGQHKKVTLQEQADLGTGAVGATILGSQTVSGKGELVYTDEDDNDIQLTSAGKIPVVRLADDQTIEGIKTFSSFPITPSSAPTTDYQVANKKYVDDAQPVGDMPTGVETSQASLGGNVSASANGSYYYISIGKDSNGITQMASGVANTGTAIPLPTGCAQENCHWLVSIKTCTVSQFAFYAMDIAIDSSRVVTIRVSGNNWVS